MRSLKSFLCFLILGICLLISGCGELDSDKIKDLLKDIDYTAIAKEEDKQIVEVFDRYGYIPLSNEYYNVNSIDEHISDEILVLTKFHDFEYEKLNEKYNNDYYQTHALIVVPFMASVSEFEKGISINSVYANMQGGVIVFNIDSSEMSIDEETKTKTFLFEIEYDIIDLDKIIGIDVSEALGFDVNITPDLFSEYVNNIQIMVNNKATLNDIDNLQGSKYYKSYKELVNKDIMVVEGYDNERVEILKNFKMDAEGDTYSEKAYVDTYRKMQLFKEALENVKFVKSDAFYDTEEFLYQITYGYITIQIIDAHHFDYWRYNYYVGTCEIIEGSFAFVNKFFYVENEALNDFLSEIYNAIEYLTVARMVGSQKLDMLYDFCEIVSKWECVEDFGDFNIIDQLKIILNNVEFEEEMRVEIENTIVLLEELLKDVPLKQRRFVTLDYGFGELEKFKVFDDQEYELPVAIRKGSLFCGWYDEEGNLWDKGVYDKREDITLSARWVDAKDFDLGVCQNFGKTKTYRCIDKYVGEGNVVVLPAYDESGDEINYINYAAFQDNEVIETVYFSHTIKELDVGCFRGCKNLKEVYLGEGIIDLGHYAFADCSNLTYVYFPEGVTSTGNYTFHNCFDLESIEFPSTIYRYGVNMFQGCVNLRTINVREGGKFESVENCVMQGDKLIVGCKGSTIPNYTKYIAQYAFYKIHFEKEIVLPDTIYMIYEGAFFNTSGINKLYIPKYITYIGELAFTNVSYELYIYAYEHVSNWSDRWTNMKVNYYYDE